MAVGSISINGLLGGTAGKIDTEALINALMAAKSMPKQQLQLQVAQQGKVTQAYQSVNSTMSAITTAADKLRDDAAWTATKASSSSSAVVASSVSTAAAGSSTFTVSALAQAQVSTVSADGDGNVIDFASNPTFTLTVGGEEHELTLESGSAADVAKAINDAGIGIRAAVINTDQGQMLQITGAKTGAANSFSSADLALNAPLVSAQDAKITVGDPLAGGYTISSASNTFTDAMPGVTFTLGAGSVNEQVTITVASDTSKVASVVKGLTDAVNSARLAIDNYTDKGGVLQGDSQVTSLTQDLSFVFTSATAAGKSLTEYGIEISKEGLVSFDQDVFAAAYNADPTGTMQAISDAVATPLKNISEAASAPITGSLSQAITSGNDRVTDLNKRIDDMSERLNVVEDQLRTKYVAMQTALAKLQSQGDWLTSMFKSMDASNKDD